MNKKKLIVFLSFIIIILVLNSPLIHAQLPPGYGDEDPGTDLPIPGILYFLAALIGIGVKKLYHGRKKN